MTPAQIIEVATHIRCLGDEVRAGHQRQDQRQMECAVNQLLGYLDGLAAGLRAQKEPTA